MYPELAVIGYTTIDHITSPNRHTEEVGGGAYFSALAASLITNSVGLVTRVGEDFDFALLEGRVMTEGVRKIESQKTTHSYVAYKSQDDPTARDIHLELNVSSQLEGKDFPTDWKLTTFVHIATMFPSQQHAILQIIRNLCPNSIISIDTDLHHFTSEENIAQVKTNLRESDLVFLNRREYKFLKSAADTLPNVVVKLDKDGALLLKNGKVVQSTAVSEVAVVDPTGAGDVFAGVFLAALLKQKNESEALQLAAEIATLSVIDFGVKHIFTKGLR